MEYMINGRFAYWPGASSAPSDEKLGNRALLLATASDKMEFGVLHRFSLLGGSINFFQSNHAWILSNAVGSLKALRRLPSRLMALVRELSESTSNSQFWLASISGSGSASFSLVSPSFLLVDEGNPQ